MGFVLVSCSLRYSFPGKIGFQLINLVSLDQSFIDWRISQGVAPIDAEMGFQRGPCAKIGAE